ncbi:MAG: hypothetical protein LR015_09320 [Verrucomicrobia bacterium]|nr:hypothetical protein [Verrucomicrobiota bacterium]
MSWNLRQLFEGLVELPTTVDIDAVEITAGIECRADKVSAGTVYFAFAEYLRYNGWLEGKDDLNLAIANGAVAVVIDAAACSKDISVPVIQADDVRALCGRVAARYWGLEAENLPLIGITGTNGKTTTALLSHFVLHQCGISSGCWVRWACITTVGRSENLNTLLVWQ